NHYHECRPFVCHQLHAGLRPRDVYPLLLVYNITTERSAARYVLPFTDGAFSQGTMSSGESSAVSIHRRHVPPSSMCSSNSSGTQDAFRMRKKRKPSLRSSAPKATLCELSPQSGWNSFTPCQALFACSSIVVRLVRCRSCSTVRKSRRSISNFKKRCTSACLSTRVQSNQLVSLS